MEIRVHLDGLRGGVKQRLGASAAPFDVAEPGPVMVGPDMRLSHRDEEQQRNNPPEQLGEPAVRQLAVVLDAFRFELLGQLRIVHPRRRELPLVVALIERPANHLLADRDVGDLSGFQERLEFGVSNAAAGRRQVIHLRQAEEQHEGEPVPQRGRRPRGQRPLAAAIAGSRIETGGWFLRRHDSNAGGKGRIGRKGRKGRMG